MQDNLKKLVAYSSIAHIGLMAAGVFTLKSVAMHGLVLQMFNHGINIIGMWLVVAIIEKKTGVKTISGLSGMANVAPVLTIFFFTLLLVVCTYQNIVKYVTHSPFVLPLNSTVFL